MSLYLLARYELEPLGSETILIKLIGQICRWQRLITTILKYGVILGGFTLESTPGKAKGATRDLGSRAMVVAWLLEQ